MSKTYAEAYPTMIGAEATAKVIAGLVGAVEADDPALGTRYRDVNRKVGAFFDAWFAMGGGAGKPKGRKEAAKGKAAVPADAG